MPHHDVRAGLDHDVFAELQADSIVYRDDALIALSKPAGLSTASSDGTDDLVGRVRRWLATERKLSPEQIYVGVHEHLERDTSGIVIFTLDKRANRGLAEQLEAHTPRRCYELMARGDRQPRTLGPTTKRAGKLRAELAKEGTPVIGDAINGGEPAFRVMCHAATISLLHPLDRTPLTLTAKAPPSLTRGEDLRLLVRMDATLRGTLLREAGSKRAPLLRLDTSGATTAFRWINGAHDGFEGIAIDVYGDWLVLHVFDDLWLPQCDMLARELHALTTCRGIYVKRHPKQKNELDADAIATLAEDRPVLGDPAPDPLRIVEHGVPLFVRLGDGLRTGLFLDQRDNRLRVRELARDKRVLNLFAYTCGFSVAAVVGGAREVLSVDASQLVMSRSQASFDELHANDRHQTLVGDCFEILRALAQRPERFDLVIVDPPSYASTVGGRFRLRRDFAQLVADAIAVCAPDATLLCCTNHHGTSERDLRAFVLSGLNLAGREGQVRTVPPALDFAAGGSEAAELKSAWLTLQSVLRPKRGRV